MYINNSEQKPDKLYIKENSFLREYIEQNLEKFNLDNRNKYDKLL